MGNPPDAAQQRTPEGHEIRNAGLHGKSAIGQGFVGEVGAVAEFLEGDAGQQQHAGAVDLDCVVEVVDVYAGVFANVLVGVRQQFDALAELGGDGGAGFG